MGVVTAQDIRDEAILICAVAASTPGVVTSFGTISAWLGADEPSTDLAILAWSSALARLGASTLFDIAAEAEAMLQCGWSPS